MVCHLLSLLVRLILFDIVAHIDYVYCYKCSFRQGRKNPNQSSSIQSNCHSKQCNYHNLHNILSHQSSLCHNKQVMRNDYFLSNHPILRFHIQVLFEDLIQIVCKIFSVHENIINFISWNQIIISMILRWLFSSLEYSHICSSGTYFFIQFTTADTRP